MSQTALAEKFGCSKRTILRAEAGQPLIRSIIDKYIALSNGSLVLSDFKERSHAYRKRKNGRKS